MPMYPNQNAADGKSVPRRRNGNVPELMRGFASITNPN